VFDMCTAAELERLSSQVYGQIHEMAFRHEALQYGANVAEDRGHARALAGSAGIALAAMEERYELLRAVNRELRRRNADTSQTG
jgi:hypothetical protein